jgi:hypothetical protein
MSTKSGFRLLLLAVVLFSLISLTANEAEPAVLLHRNLRDLTQAARTIFIGTCASASNGTTHTEDIGIIGYTEYSFEVGELIKGEPSRGTTFVFRQPGTTRVGLPRPALPALGSATAHQLMESPSYIVGQKYLIFLHAENAWGLTAPVGLLQGTFRLHSDENGETTAINGIDNLGLFEDMTTSAEPSAMRLALNARKMLRQGKGPVELTTLLSFTRGLLAVSKTR